MATAQQSTEALRGMTVKFAKAGLVEGSAVMDTPRAEEVDPLQSWQGDIWVSGPPLQRCGRLKR